MKLPQGKRWFEYSVIMMIFRLKGRTRILVEDWARYERFKFKGAGLDHEVGWERVVLWSKFMALSRARVWWELLCSMMPTLLNLSSWGCKRQKLRDVYEASQLEPIHRLENSGILGILSFMEVKIIPKSF